jgi:hypothetical protein
MVAAYRASTAPGIRSMNMMISIAKMKRWYDLQCAKRASVASRCRVRTRTALATTMYLAQAQNGSNGGTMYSGAMGNGMGGMGIMMIVWILVLVLIVLAIAALIKYLFRR